MRIIVLTILSAMCLALVGCSKPKINAVTPEMYQKTLNEMKASLSSSKQTQLDEAIKVIFDAEHVRAQKYGNPMGEHGIMLKLDEMTADDIIAKAKTYQQ